jgi:hypothetical protein
MARRRELARHRRSFRVAAAHQRLTIMMRRRPMVVVLRHLLLPFPVGLPGAVVMAAFPWLFILFDILLSDEISSFYFYRIPKTF